VANQFYTTRLPYRDECLSHERYPEPTPLPFGNDAPASSLFEVARESLAGPMTLALERDLVTAIDCPRCGWHVEVNRPRTRVAMSEAVCPNCREPGRPEVVSSVEEGSPLAGLPLSRLGVPGYDVVRVDGEKRSGFFLLSGQVL
jgi:adenylyltransferase/sulfurtransferase